MSIVAQVLFQDGKAFSNAITSIRQTSTSIPFYFTPSGLTIQYANSTATVMVSVSFNTDKILRYYYNYRDENGELLPELKLSFVPGDIARTLKNTATQDKILMTIHEDLQQMVISIGVSISVGAKKSNYARVQEIPSDRIEEPSASTFGSPIVKCESTEFAENCASIISQRATKMAIEIHQSYGIARGIDSLGSMVSSFVMGTIPEVRMKTVIVKTDDGRIIKKSVSIDNIVSVVSIDSNIVKALSKTKSLFKGSSTMNIFILHCDEGMKTMKFETDISNYGALAIYIRVPEEHESPTDE